MILLLHNNLNKYIEDALTSVLYNRCDIEQVFKEDKTFLNVISSIKRILDRNHYVILKSFPLLDNVYVFDSFSLQFGIIHRPADLVETEYAKVSLECDRTSGCNFRSIPLHNDETHENIIPKYGFILNINEDPVSDVKNNIVKIGDLMTYLEIKNRMLHDSMLEHQFYMYQFNKKLNQIIKIKKPLILKKNNQYFTQFHYERIKNFYKHNNLDMPHFEKNILLSFLEEANKFKQSYLLKQGDLLIHNNKKVLHDRENCNVMLEKNNKILSREIWVNFVQ